MKWVRPSGLPPLFIWIHETDMLPEEKKMYTKDVSFAEVDKIQAVEMLKWKQQKKKQEEEEENPLLD